MRFGTVIADPPWAYAHAKEYKGLREDGTTKALGGYANFEYGLLDTKGLMALPVQEVCEPNSVLLLWTTAPFIPDAVEVLGAWGFTYKTMATWGKIAKHGGVHGGGVGTWFRGAAEYVMVGKRGNWGVGRTGAPSLYLDEEEQSLLQLLHRLVDNSTISPLMLREKLPHSEKPNWMHEYAEANFSHLGARLELFGRRLREGWTVLGNEAPGDGQLLQDSLPELIALKPSSATNPAGAS